MKQLHITLVAIEIRICEKDQLNKIFEILGTPNIKTWPNMIKLPNCKVLLLF